MNKTALFSLACLLTLTSACGWWRKKVPCCPVASPVVLEDPAYGTPLMVENAQYAPSAVLVEESAAYAAPLDPYYAQEAYAQGAPEAQDNYMNAEDQVAQAFPSDQAYGYSEELNQVAPLENLDQYNMNNHPNYRNKAVSLSQDAPAEATALDSEVDFLK